MKHKIHILLKLLSLGFVCLVPLTVVSQELPVDVPAGAGDETPEDLPGDEEPPEDVPGDEEPPVDLPDGAGPPDDVPQGPPAEIQEFIDAMKGLQGEFLEVVHAEYESGEARAAAIQEWIDLNKAELESIEAAKDAFEREADLIEVPDTELAVDVEEDLEEFEENEEALENSLGAIMEQEYSSPEERLAAIQQWRSEHEAELAAQEASRQALLDQIEAGRGNAPDRGERPEDTPRMKDLEELFAQNLADLETGNADLESKLAQVQADREERLRLLEEAREARLQEMENARELARQQREEARQNVGEDRRPDDG
jgi:hypothetical protein